MPGYTGNDFKKKHDLQKTRQGEKRERKGGKMLKQNREQNGEDGGRVRYYVYSNEFYLFMFSIDIGKGKGSARNRTPSAEIQRWI
jgi:hypothetical protein